MTRIQSYSLVGALAALLVIAWLSRERAQHSSSSPPNASTAAPTERVASSADPDELFSALSSDSQWKRLQSGSRFTFTYTQRPFGELALEDARIRALPDGAYTLQAAAFSWGSANWRDLSLTLRRHVETIELRQEPSGDFKPFEVNYTKGRGGGLWALALPHQSARAALLHYAPELAPESARTELLASLSLVAPQAADKPLRGNLELVLDAWEHPDWPDARALFGDTLSVGGRVEPSELGATWRVEDVRVSTLLFTLSGKGRIEWRRSPALQLEVSGSLTCRQLGANLAPSVYLDEVKRFLDGASPVEQAGKVELSLHVDLDAEGGRRDAVWRLSGGCGLSAR